MTDAVLARFRTAGAIVPAVRSLDVNTLPIGECRGRVTSDDIAVFVNLLQTLRIEIEPGSSLATAVGPVHEIGRVHGLSSDDASYVERALRRRLPLATLDARTRAAAVDPSVPLVARPVAGAGDASSSGG